MVHSLEWTTSWGGNGEKGQKQGESRELVVHFKEWTTGWARNLEKGPEMR